MAKYRTRRQGSDGIRVGGEFHLIARDPKIRMFYGSSGIVRGKVLWEEKFHNVVMDAAINDMLSVAYDNGTQKPQWYIGPINNTPEPEVLSSHTAASHAEWSEGTTYSESTRQAYNPTVSNKVMTNSASAATITASGSFTVAGAFIISDNTKSGTSGILHSAGLFTGGDQVLATSQTLDLIYRLTVSN